jgi:hypothetical protein
VFFFFHQSQRGPQCSVSPLKHLSLCICTCNMHNIRYLLCFFDFICVFLLCFLSLYFVLYVDGLSVSLGRIRKKNGSLMFCEQNQTKKNKCNQD